jgi:O-antigen ligase
MSPQAPARAFRGALGVALLAALVGLLAALLAVAADTLALAVPVAVAGAYALVRRPAVLLAVFLYIPFFEAAPVVRDLPFDPTPAFAALMVLALVLRTGATPLRRPPAGFLVPVLVIGGALLIGLLWTADSTYAQEKVLKYLTVTLIAALAPFAVLTTERALRQFLVAIVAGALLVAVLTLITPPTVAEGITSEFDTQGRFSFGGQIFPARFLCTGALIMFLVPGLTASRWRWAAPVAAVGVLLVASGYGARGPIAAFVATMVAVILVLALRSGRHLAIVLAAVAITAAALPFVTVPETAGERIEEAARDPVATLRGDTRHVLYDQATTMIVGSPLLGEGTGSFAAYSAIVSPRRQTLLYPHNIFLELWAEIGIIPLLAFVVAVVGGVAMLMRRLVVADDRRERQLLTLVFGLFVLNFFASQVSGDINDSRTTLVFLGLAWMLGRYGIGSERRSA